MVDKLFDLAQFDKYQEDNRREVKSARNGIPDSLWETYSAFANTEGGVIILGVKEREDKSWYTTGLKNTSKLEKEFWDLVNNKQKVSINLLSENSLETYDVNGDTIMVIYVPKAHREEKPVYKGTDMFTGTYRRDGEGGYLCTKSQVLAMLRDQTEDTIDMKVMDSIQLSELNQETIRGYRNMHQNISEGHPFSRLGFDEYMRSIGAAAISEKDGKLHPTTAGLLMFGNDYDIVREFPEYFLDYREQLDPSIRWTDRLWSSSGTWSGNVFDFFLRAYNKIALGLKIPFHMDGIMRIDDTPVHKAVREALVNCLSNADYYGVQGVVIKRTPTQLILENPGYIRIGKHQMIQGGISDPRNKTILKMFNLLDIGERSGSGVPNIFNVWSDQGWPAPTIIEESKPLRTRIILEFNEQANKTSGQANKTSEQAGKTSEQANKTSELAGKTSEHKRKIIAFLRENGTSGTNDIAKMLSLSPARVRVILGEMVKEGILTAEGKTNARQYRIAENQ